MLSSLSVCRSAGHREAGPGPGRGAGGSDVESGTGTGTTRRKTVRARERGVTISKMGEVMSRSWNNVPRRTDCGYERNVMQKNGD
jgi:hypothetical protein